MRRAISLVVLLLVFSPLTELSAEQTSLKEETSLFASWFDGSIFGGSSDKKTKTSLRSNDRDFDVDVADRSSLPASKQAPYFVADASSHKGSNYSLGEYPKKPLPDCSEFIDPKDAKKFSHCHGVVEPPEKWQGYLEFLGKPGTARNLGQSDLFVPVNQDENDMTFFNLRGQMDDNDTSEYNVGFGHRHMFDESSDSPLRGWIIGGYGYFDNRFTDFGNSFKQLTFGVEALSEDWDIRGNGYIPENKTETITAAGADTTVVRLPQNQIKARVSGAVEETALAGFDGEVGYRLPLSKVLPKTVNDLEWFEDTRLYMGGYHFIGEGNFESVSGPRVRLETRIHDLPILGNGSRLMLGLESQYDDPRGSQTFGLVQLRIPFGAFDNRRRVPALKGLDRRMMQPVVRDVDIVAPTFEDASEDAPLLNENGQEITAAFDLEMSADCDEDCMQEKLTNMMAGMEEDDAVVIFVKGMAANVTDVNGENVTVMDWDGNMNVGGALNKSQMIVASAGKDWNVTYDSEKAGVGVVTHNEDGTPVGTNGSGCWTLSDGAQLNGWTMEGSESGACATAISIADEGTYHISNTTIKNFRSNGINVNNANATVNIDGLTVDGVRSYGLHLNNGTVNLRNAEFIGRYINNSAWNLDVDNDTDGFSNLAIYKTNGNGTLLVEDSVIRGLHGKGGIQVWHGGGDVTIRRTSISFDNIVDYIQNNINRLDQLYQSSVQDLKYHSTNGQFLVQHGIFTEYTGTQTATITIDNVTIENYGGFGIWDRSPDNGDRGENVVFNISNTVVKNGTHTSHHGRIALDDNGFRSNRANSYSNNNARGWGMLLASDATVNITNSQVFNSQTGGIKFHDVNNEINGTAYLRNVEVFNNGTHGLIANNGRNGKGFNVYIDNTWEEVENLVYDNAQDYLNQGGNLVDLKDGVGQIFVKDQPCTSADDANPTIKIDCTD